MRKPIKKAPIREQIYYIIRNDIMERKYALGERLSIAALSKQLDVSNSPVREAISMLERDGLVETYPNAGPSVVSLSDEKLKFIAEAILSMLLGCFELCQMQGRIDELIYMLQDALREQTQHVNTDDQQEYVRYSTAFEFCFVKCCQNPYLSKQYEEIETLFYLIVLYDQWYIDTNRRLTIVEHQNILGSIRDGDFNKAKKLIYDHYNRF